MSAAWETAWSVIWGKASKGRRKGKTNGGVRISFILGRRRLCPGCMQSSSRTVVCRNCAPMPAIIFCLFLPGPVPTFFLSFLTLFSKDLRMWEEKRAAGGRRSKIDETIKVQPTGNATPPTSTMYGHARYTAGL
ncbi:hypothetical protein LY76DRAFT_21312 [Colletotrichum caudatum]|nr:hypothetical protein LY76DRAFT_21312 [Colletotrichum caudatum]